MKFIAHRGASTEVQENTVAGMALASDIGAYAAECDLRKTSDGRLVLFHDINIKRMCGIDRLLAETSFDEAKELFDKAGTCLDTFEDLCEKYVGDAYILCDIGNEDWYGGFLWDCDDAFFKMLSDAPFKVICGVHKTEEARLASRYFPKEQILAFMPGGTVCRGFLQKRCGHNPSLGAVA